jgi:hypothetical protein
MDGLNDGIDCFVALFVLLLPPPPPPPLLRNFLNQIESSY